MKNTLKKLLLLFLFALVSRMYAQTGSVCTASETVPVVTVNTALSLSAGNVKWLSFTNSNVNIVFSKNNNPNWKLKKYQIYSGTCTALVLLKTDSNPNPDSSFYVRPVGNNGFIKIEFIGNTSNAIQFILAPKITSVVNCNPTECNFVSNGSFNNIDPCVNYCTNNQSLSCSGSNCGGVYSCPYGFGYVPNWPGLLVDGTPQIGFAGGNVFAYMWTNGNVSPSQIEAEKITNELCTNLDLAHSYTVKADIAFVNANPPSPPFTNGTKVDQFIVNFYSSGASPTVGNQKIVVASNISNQNFFTVTANFNATGYFDRMQVYPYNNSSLTYSGFKVDNISVTPQYTQSNFVANFPSPLCASSPIIPNLAAYCTLNGVPLSNVGGYYFTGSTGIVNTNGVYSFDPALATPGVNNIFYNYVNCPGNTYVVGSSITINTSNCCSTQNYTVPTSTSVLLSSLVPAVAPFNISNKIFEIQVGATLIVNYPVTFDHCIFRMGVSSTVQTSISGTGSKVVNLINNCQMFTCGSKMHSGIIVNSGHTLNASNSKFEDARFAIRLYPGSITNLTSNIFNKNYIGVYIDQEGGFPTANLPYVFNNNSFTTNASANSPTLTMKDVIPLLGTAVITPARGYAGIYSSNMGNTFAIKIGEVTTPTAGNTFDNIDIGIYLDRTKAEIYNNTFNTNNGTGIRTSTLNGTTVNYGYNLIVGNANTNGANKFNNCKYGIELGNGYSNVNIEWNQFIGSPLNTNLFAINAPIDKMTTLNVNNNTSNYYNNFFQHSIPALPIVTSPTVSLNVKNNTISNAITPIFVALNGAANSTAFGYEIFDNTISASANGIISSNMAKCLRINTNDITLFASSSGFSEGISLSGGCDNAIVSANKIKSNAVGISSVSNPDLYGIRVLQSAMTIITCNTLSLLGTCLGFEGSCLTTSQGVESNKMNSGVYGFRLLNSGRIGTQGSATNRNTNSWGAAATGFPGTTRYQTYVENTTNVGSLTAGSVLYLGLPAYPTDNGFAPTFSPYSSTLIPQSIRQGGNGTGVFSCPVGPPGGGGTGTTTAARIVDVGTPIANNTATFGTFSADNKVRAKQQLYQLVTDEPAAKTNATINTFYNTEQNTSIGKLKQLETAIAQQNYTSATAINNSILPVTNTEVSEKEYYQLYLKWISDASNFSTQDKNDLLILANRCITKRGSVIIKARNLYDLITSTKNVYCNTCASATNSKVINAFQYDGADDSPIEKSNTAVNKLNPVSIAPNPNSGKFSVIFDIGIENPIFISITDLSGKVIWSESMNVKEQQTDIDVNPIRKGIYILTVSDNNEINYKSKLVISKND
jgi:Secretion system C-terminal sorting domain